MEAATDDIHPDRSIIAVEISEFARTYRAPVSMLLGLLVVGVSAYIAYELAFGRLDTSLRLKGIAALAGAAAALPHLPAIYFNTVLDTLAKTPCLILSEHDFTDTRVSDDAIAWTNVRKIEEWRPWTYVRGLKLTLSQPCTFNSAYLLGFGQSRLFASYVDPCIVHVSLWTLRYKKQALIDEFKRRQQCQ